MRRVNDERGAVAVVVALMLATTLMGVTALAIDVGTMLLQRRTLQNGVDASALAIATDCARHAVDPVANPTPCTLNEALMTATGYVAANGASGASVDRDLDVSYGGDVGRITVTGSVTSGPGFARFLGFANPFPVAASATARWGPLTAIDKAFPLAVCRGALPPSGSPSTTLVIDPANPADPDDCDGAPSVLPFGWIPPDDLNDCTSKVTVLPSTYLNVGAPDAPPTSSVGCTTALATLFLSMWAPASQRTRVLPVFDAASGTPGARPSYSLIAFEFTGLRIGALEAHRGWHAACPSGQHCIRGRVKDYIAPTDGPIFDPALAAVGTIADTSVLDVRLVD